MIRAFAIQMMILISLFTAWGVGFASQFDDCCVERLQDSSHFSESKSKVFASLEEHPDDCAARCTDCVICISQCNQHGMISLTVPVLGLDFVQTHNFSFVHSYTNVHLSVLKEPPRV